MGKEDQERSNSCLTSCELRPWNYTHYNGYNFQLKNNEDFLRALFFHVRKLCLCKYEESVCKMFESLICSISMGLCCGDYIGS